MSLKMEYPSNIISDGAGIPELAEVAKLFYDKSAEIAIPLLAVVGMWSVLSVSWNSAFSHSGLAIVRAFVRIIVCATLLASYQPMFLAVNGIFSSIYSSLGGSDLAIPLEKLVSALLDASLNSEVGLLEIGWDDPLLFSKAIIWLLGKFILALIMLFILVGVVLSNYIAFVMSYFCMVAIMAILYGVGPIVIAFAANPNYTNIARAWFDNVLRTMAFFPVALIVLNITGVVIDDLSYLELIPKGEVAYTLGDEGSKIVTGMLVDTITFMQSFVRVFIIAGVSMALITAIPSISSDVIGGTISQTSYSVANSVATSFNNFTSSYIGGFMKNGLTSVSTGIGRNMPTAFRTIGNSLTMERLHSRAEAAANSSSNRVGNFLQNRLFESFGARLAGTKGGILGNIILRNGQKAEQKKRHQKAAAAIEKLKKTSKSNSKMSDDIKETGKKVLDSTLNTSMSEQALIHEAMNNADFVTKDSKGNTLVSIGDKIYVMEERTIKTRAHDISAFGGSKSREERHLVLIADIDLRGRMDSDGGGVVLGLPPTGKYYNGAIGTRNSLSPQERQFSRSDEANWRKIVGSEIKASGLVLGEANNGVVTVVNSGKIYKINSVTQDLLPGKELSAEEGHALLDKHLLNAGKLENAHSLKEEGYLAGAAGGKLAMQIKAKDGKRYKDKIEVYKDGDEFYVLRNGEITSYGDKSGKISQLPSGAKVIGEFDPKNQSGDDRFLILDENGFVDSNKESVKAVQEKSHLKESNALLDYRRSMEELSNSSNFHKEGDLAYGLAFGQQVLLSKESGKWQMKEAAELNDVSGLNTKGANSLRDKFFAKVGDGSLVVSEIEQYDPKGGKRLRPGSMSFSANAKATSDGGLVVGDGFSDPSKGELAVAGKDLSDIINREFETADKFQAMQLIRDADPKKAYFHILAEVAPSRIDEILRRGGASKSLRKFMKVTTNHRDGDGSTRVDDIHKKLELIERSYGIDVLNITEPTAADVGVIVRQLDSHINYDRMKDRMSAYSAAENAVYSQTKQGQDRIAKNEAELANATKREREMLSGEVPIDSEPKKLVRSGGDTSSNNIAPGDSFAHKNDSGEDARWDFVLNTAENANNGEILNAIVERHSDGGDGHVSLASKVRNYGKVVYDPRLAVNMDILRDDSITNVHARVDRLEDMVNDLDEQSRSEFRGLQNRSAVTHDDVDKFIAQNNFEILNKLKDGRDLTSSMNRSEWENDSVAMDVIQSARFQGQHADIITDRRAQMIVEQAKTYGNDEVVLVGDDKKLENILRAEGINVSSSGSVEKIIADGKSNLDGKHVIWADKSSMLDAAIKGSNAKSAYVLGGSEQLVTSLDSDYTIDIARSSSETVRTLDSFPRDYMIVNENCSNATKIRSQAKKKPATSGRSSRGSSVSSWRDLKSIGSDALGKMLDAAVKNPHEDTFSGGISESVLGIKGSVNLSSSKSEIGKIDRWLNSLPRAVNEREVQSFALRQENHEALENIIGPKSEALKLFKQVERNTYLSVMGEFRLVIKRDEDGLLYLDSKRKVSAEYDLKEKAHWYGYIRDLLDQRSTGITSGSYGSATSTFALMKINYIVRDDMTLALESDSHDLSEGSASAKSLWRRNTPNEIAEREAKIAPYINSGLTKKWTNSEGLECFSFVANDRLVSLAKNVMPDGTVVHSPLSMTLLSQDSLRDEDDNLCRSYFEEMHERGLKSQIQDSASFAHVGSFQLDGDESMTVLRSPEDCVVIYQRGKFDREIIRLDADDKLIDSISEAAASSNGSASESMTSNVLVLKELVEAVDEEKRISWEL